MTEPGQVTTRYAYDEYGNRTQLILPGATTFFEYDDLNRVEQIRYPDGGAESYNYNDIGLLTTWFKLDGSTVSYNYDEVNNLTSVLKNGTQEVAYTYDDLNRVTNQTFPTGSHNYTYHPGGLLQSRGPICYEYDDLDRVTTVFDGPNRTDYTYTARSQIKTVERDSQAVSYGYDLSDNLTSIVYPNGIDCSMNYDERERLLDSTYLRNMSDQVLSFTYKYDQVGNITEIARDSQSFEPITRKYFYNDRYELTRVDKFVDDAFQVEESFDYDQRQNRTDVGGVNATVNLGDEMKTQGSDQLSYLGGAIANLNRGSGIEFFQNYNFLDQPRVHSGPSGTTTFEYDGEGQRQRKVASGVTCSYLWMGSEILREDWGPATKREYLLGNGREGLKQDGQWYFYHKDHLGSTILMTDSGGNVVGEWDYQAYGKHTFVSPPNTVAEGNEFLYAGQQLDHSTGQYYMRARYYDPLYGRFLVRDPIRHEGGNNLYAYANNNPINFSDPSGLVPPTHDPATQVRHFDGSGHGDDGLLFRKTVEFVGWTVLFPLGGRGMTAVRAAEAKAATKAATARAAAAEAAAKPGAAAAETTAATAAEGLIEVTKSGGLYFEMQIPMHGKTVMFTADAVVEGQVVTYTSFGATGGGGIPTSVMRGGLEDIARFTANKFPDATKLILKYERPGYSSAAAARRGIVRANQKAFDLTKYRP